MRIGYIRVSGIAYGPSQEEQQWLLLAAGVQRVVVEHAASPSLRPLREGLLAVLGPGDQLVVATLERLARSLAELSVLMERLDRAGASLCVLSFGVGGLDTSTPEGRSVVATFGPLREFERVVLEERRRDGIARAAALGRHGGGAVPTAINQAEKIVALRGKGLSYVRIGRRLRINERSVRRVLRRVECGEIKIAAS